MAVRDILEDLENLVADAAHVPLSGKCMIDENDLVHLVEELRNTLPTALQQAESIMLERDGIIEKAQNDARNMLEEAKREAERRIASSTIEREAREKARTILDEASEEAQDILKEARNDAEKIMNEGTEKAQNMMEEARSRGEELYTQAIQKKQNVDDYANQVFNQLINLVTSTCNVIQQSEQGLDHAKTVLESAQAQLNAQ